MQSVVPQGVNFLLALGLGNIDDTLVSPRAAHVSQSDPRVASRSLNTSTWFIGNKKWCWQAKKHEQAPYYVSYEHTRRAGTNHKNRHVRAHNNCGCSYSEVQSHAVVQAIEQGG